MPSSALDAILDGFGMGEAEEESTPSGPPGVSLFPAGHQVAGRYTITGLVDRWEGGAFYRAHDVVLDRAVVLKTLDAAGADGTEELQRQELLLARALSHPNICRVHDLVHEGERRFLVMEAFDTTLDQRVREWRQRRSRPLLEEIRALANGIAEALGAVHDRGLVHGALNPLNIAIRDEKPLLLFGPATERERVLSGAPAQALARIDSRYFSPERLADGHTGRSDDVYALGLLIWSLLAGQAPSLGINPRHGSLLAHVDARTVMSLSFDELLTMHACLAGDAGERPRARDVRLGERSCPSRINTIDAGPPAGVGAELVPGAHALLVTVAPTAPRLVGTLFPLESPTVRVGRHGKDLEIAERTLSRHHATLRWAGGSWTVHDENSRNGTYLDHSNRRRSESVLRHGDELQLGELRVKLVSFAPSSVLHWRARRFLETHDGLTGMLVGREFLAAAERAAEFADWSGSRLYVATLRLTLANDRQATTLMVGARRAARHLVEELSNRWAGAIECGFLRQERLAPGGVAVFFGVMVGRRGLAPEGLARAVVAEANQLLPRSCWLDVSLAERSADAPIIRLLETTSSAPPRPSS